MFEKQDEKFEGIARNPKLVRILSNIVLIFTIIVTVAVSLYLYSYTQRLLTQRLFERMEAIVATASMMLDGDQISNIVESGPRSNVGKPYYIDLVKSLQSIKKANDDVIYAYIYGKTDDPNNVMFVADADVIALLPDLNFNEYQVTEEGFPGSLYDVSDIPLITDGEVYKEVVVDDYFYETIWGTLATAYAPLPSKDGTVSAVLAIDIDISNFNRLVKATFIPFGLFVVCLVTLLILLSQILIRAWSTRVKLVQELDRQKDELLGIVSHQLATPISSAKWYLEMLHDGDIGKLSKEQKEHVKSIQGIANTLTDLVGMILDVSRIQLGRMKADRSKVDVAQLFDEILTVIKPKAEEKKIDFVVDMPKKLPVAMLDRRLTRMTLENLLSNAVKYTPEKGKVEFKVQLKDDKLTYSVKDTGLGIPKEDQDKMFQKLYRASNVQSMKGNGFGLYVAKGAVEAQGGAIAFESEEGKGTTFTVELPI